MRRLIAACAALFLLAGPALADTEGAALNPGNRAPLSSLQGCVYRATPVVAIDGQQLAAGCDASGAMNISVGTGAAAQQVQGNSASGVADVGNPVKIGGVYSSTTIPSLSSGQRGDLQIGAQGGVGLSALAGNTWTAINSGSNIATTGSGTIAASLAATYNTAPPIYTNGQFGMVQMGSRGSLNTTLFAQDNTTAIAAIGQSGDGISTGTVGLAVAGFGRLYNGASWDRQVSVGGAIATGVGTAAVAIAPTSAAAAAIAPTTTAAVASNQVLKATAGNGYRYAITTGASAGYLMVFDATTAPADGAVTPKICRAVAANSSLEIDHAAMPDRFSTGITEVFSTTGCYNKTASATADLEGWFQ